MPSASRTSADSRTARTSDAVRAGVRPDGATDRARDGQPELEARQAGALGLGRGAGHRDARLGGVARPVDPAALGPDVDDQAADAASEMTTLLPRPSSVAAGRARGRTGRAARSSKALCAVGEQVGRAADAHGREAARAARRAPP